MQYFGVIVLVSTAAACYGDLVEPTGHIVDPSLGPMLPTIARSLQTYEVPQDLLLPIQPLTPGGDYHKQVDYRGRPKGVSPYYGSNNAKINNEETLESLLDDDNAASENEYLARKSMEYTPYYVESLQANAVPQNSPLQLQPYTSDGKYHQMDMKGRPNHGHVLPFSVNYGNMNNQPSDTLEPQQSQGLRLQPITDFRGRPNRIHPLFVNTGNMNNQPSDTLEYKPQQLQVLRLQPNTDFRGRPNRIHPLFVNTGHINN